MDLQSPGQHDFGVDVQSEVDGFTSDVHLAAKFFPIVFFLPYGDIYLWLSGTFSIYSYSQQFRPHLPNMLILA